MSSVEGNPQVDKIKPSSTSTLRSRLRVLVPPLLVASEAASPANGGKKGPINLEAFSPLSHVWSGLKQQLQGALILM